MEKQKSKREITLEKIDKRLKMIEKDPKILDYNYYNDKNFVGVKMTKEKPGVTLNGLAKKVDQLSETVDQLSETVNKLSETVNQLSETVNQLSKDLVALTKFVIEGFAEQKKFNELLLSLPTIKKEIEILKRRNNVTILEAR